MNAWSDSAVEFFDSGKGGVSYVSKHQQEATGLMKERAKLREEAISLKFADPKEKMQDSKIF
jgi:hypothetical protein